MRETISIQYLRAIAATMVVVFHVSTRVLGAQDPEPFGFAIWGGGVDIFFVVSGYIMWTTTASRPVGTARFLEARLLRIVPLYWAALALMWVVLAALKGIAGAPSVSEVVRSALFIPHRDSGTGLIAPYLVPGWTLTYEMIFYAVFGVALFLESKLARLVFVAVVFLAMTRLRAHGDASDPIVFRLTSPMFFEFLAGMVIAEAQRHLADRPHLGKSGLGALAVAAVFLVFVSAPRFETLPRVVGFGVPAALVVLGLLAFEDRIAARPIGWLKRLGDASYSLYLVHEILLKLLDPILLPSALPIAVQAAIYFAGSIAIGLTCHAFVEEPLTRAVKAWRAGRAGAARPAVAGPDVEVAGEFPGAAEPASAQDIPGLVPVAVAATASAPRRRD
jgi:exopolysaccharide production protein ExoZ